MNKKLLDVTIELSTKNIIVTFVYENGLSERRGFSPVIPQDWDSIEEHVELIPYKNIAWNGLNKPIEGGE